MSVSGVEDGVLSAPAAILTFGVHVAEGDSLVGTMAPIAATEGAVFSRPALATFSDASYPDHNPADFTATVDWGNGEVMSGQVSTAGDGTFTVAGSVIYAEEGAYPVKVTLAEDSPGGAMATAATTATVAEGDVLGAGPALTANAKEGTAFNGIVATFGDSGYPNNLPTNFTATIDWGDGTTTAGSVTSQAGRRVYRLGASYVCR